MTGFTRGLGWGRIHSAPLVIFPVALVAIAARALWMNDPRELFISPISAAMMTAVGYPLAVLAIWLVRRFLPGGVMGPEVGTYIRKVHESHGVIFHLGQTVSRVEGSRVILSDGSAVEMDFIVLGVGVRPAIALCEQAGLAMDRGVCVNEFLETSAPGIFAAGDIARWPDPHSGERIRVEHWVVAERQGQVAAKNILGQRVRYDAVPFFWSQHYDVAINYVGHVEKWDAVEIDGSLDANDCAVTYKQGGRTLAVATIYRDRQSLQAELAMEQKAQP